MATLCNNYVTTRPAVTKLRRLETLEFQVDVLRAAVHKLLKEAIILGKIPDVELTAGEIDEAKKLGIEAQEIFAGFEYPQIRLSLPVTTKI